MSANFAERVERARRYFELLSQTIELDQWEDLSRRFDAGQLPDWESTVLIHPVWCEHLDQTTPSRSRRTFQFVASKVQRCESRRIWGYDCTSNDPLQIDHRFPFALGGPTVPENAIYLCRLHNQIKGHDVHLNRWEPDEFSWLPTEIAAVRTLRNSYI